MTKLFIENLDKVNNASVRIYRVGGGGADSIPESFTMMDMLDASFGVGLLPAPTFECVGTVARSGGIIIDGDGEFGVTTEDIDVTAANTVEMLDALRAAGYRVDKLPRWTGAQIVCQGGKVESGWYDFPIGTRFELVVDGESLGSYFFVNSWDPNGNERIIRELNSRGVEIEFQQEIG